MPAGNENPRNAASSYAEAPLSAEYAIEKEEAEPLPEDPHVYQRPANEDDDDYDPWSDRHEEPPMFEPDPWN